MAQFLSDDWEPELSERSYCCGACEKVISYVPQRPHYGFNNGDWCSSCRNLIGYLVRILTHEANGEHARAGDVRETMMELWPEYEPGGRHDELAAVKFKRVGQ